MLRKAAISRLGNVKLKENRYSWFARRHGFPLVLTGIFGALFLVCSPIDQQLGLFYWAGYLLLTVTAWYAILSGHARYRLAQSQGRKALVVLVVIGIIAVLAVPIPFAESMRSRQNVFVTNYHSYDQTNPTQMTQLKKFMNNTMIFRNESHEVLDGYDVNFYLSEDPRVHGILGIIYGGAAMIVTLIGWCSRPIGNGGTPDMNSQERKKETELAKVIFNFNIVLSIIFAVMILAAGDPILMSSLRYVFIVMSFILAVLLFTLGFLASSISGANGTPFPALFIALVVSFTVGFVVGDLVFPITRVPLGIFGGNKTLYGVYPGQYVFMYASMFAIAFVGFMRTNRERGEMKEIGQREGQQRYWECDSRMKKEAWDSIKNLGTFLDGVYKGLNDLDKRLNKLAKEVENNNQLLRTTGEKVIELEAKTKKIEQK